MKACLTGCQRGSHDRVCACDADAPKAVTALKKLNVPYLVSLPLVFQTTGGVAGVGARRAPRASCIAGAQTPHYVSLTDGATMGATWVFDGNHLQAKTEFFM